MRLQSAGKIGYAGVPPKRYSRVILKFKWAKVVYGLGRPVPSHHLGRRRSCFNEKKTKFKQRDNVITGKKGKVEYNRTKGESVIGFRQTEYFSTPTRKTQQIYHLFQGTELLRQ